MRALNTKLLTGFLREKTNIEFMFQMSSMQNHTIGKLKGEVHRGLGPLLCWPLFPQPTQHSWEAQRYCLGNLLFLCSPKNSSGGSEKVPHTVHRKQRYLFSECGQRVNAALQMMHLLLQHLPCVQVRDWHRLCPSVTVVLPGKDYWWEQWVQ